MHVLVVGSSVIDLFLKIDDSHVETQDNKVILNLGDKIPAEIKKLTLGGNGANLSVGLTRLEIPTTFYTYLGTDMLSREIEEGLTREGVELVAEKGGNSSSLSIIFDFKDDRIIFSHHEKRDHSFSYNKSSAFFDFIYLTSIGDTWEKAYEHIFAFSKKENIPIVFSPGIHQLEDMGGIIGQILKASKIFFSNKQEADKLVTSHYLPAGRQGSLVTSEDGDKESIKELLLAVKALGPEIVSITDGGQGAYAIDENGNIFYLKPLPAQGAERTGAGDAYASGFFAGILHGQNVQDSMRWGTLNAHGVMQQIGAQNGLLTKKELDSKIKSADNLQAEKI